MKKKYYQRLLKLPQRSFFLFGPRGVGKTTWLHHILPNVVYFDLLNASLYYELSQSPDLLEAMIGKLPENSWIVIDEIQKIPQLLDEVHRLIESRGWRFAICGSSARKLRRGGVNLLGGRALTEKMEAFSIQELKEDYHLDFNVQWGCLPYVQIDRDQAPDILNSYANSYLKEEIREARERMLELKIDVTSFLVWFVENYPESVRRMKDDPNFDLQFR